MNELRAGLVDVVEEKEFDELCTHPHLRIKAGFDPTSPDLHLGHAVLLRKLRQFQDAGHTVVLIVGDATAAIGDPTGRNTTRPPLNATKIAENAATYTSQAFRILDRSRTVIRHNGEWLNEMRLPTVIKLISQFTVSQLLQRRDFAQRFKSEQPIHLHELLYPLMQAYDSKWEGVDIEFGGTDQLFNLLMGRELMRMSGQTPQVVCTVPLLEGLDGVHKMSKSLGNHIGLMESPLDMFSKVMSISDELMGRWLAILFPDFITLPDPFSRKKTLAWQIVKMLHNNDMAEAACHEWESIHSKRQVPSSIQTYNVPVMRLDKMIATLKFAASNSEAARLVRNGAVEVNGVVVKSERTVVDSGSLLRVGRHWARIVTV
jgi:tyrosyl-tRNA synthetase